MPEEDNIYIIAEVETVNPLGLTEEQYVIIEQMAASNFPAKQIAIYLELNADLFINEYNDSSSEVYRRYQRGMLKSTFEINQRLDENARAGNITSMQQFEKHKKSVRVQNLIEKYFG